jgi:hypothetical protein
MDVSASSRSLHHIGVGWSEAGRRWRRFVWAILHHGLSSKRRHIRLSCIGRSIRGLIAIVLTLLIISTIICFIVDTSPTMADNQLFQRVYDLLETICLVVFTCEYLLRLWCCVEDPSYHIIHQLQESAPLPRAPLSRRSSSKRMCRATSVPPATSLLSSSPSVVAQFPSSSSATSIRAGSDAERQDHHHDNKGEVDDIKEKDKLLFGDNDNGNGNDMVYKSEWHVRWHWSTRLLSLLDLVVLICFYIDLGASDDTQHTQRIFQLIRFTRILQLFRLERQLKTFQRLTRVLRSSSLEFVTSLYAGVAMILTMGIAVFMAEHDSSLSHDEQGFATLFDGLWWAASALSTLGGYHYPNIPYHPSPQYSLSHDVPSSCYII